MATYRIRYSIEEQLAPIERLEDSVSRRSEAQLRLRHEVEHLESRITELEAKRRVLDQEIAGFERALEALIDDTLDHLRIDYGEAWSPTPIHGFRMWRVESDGLHGAKERWTCRSLEARCLARGPRLDVPHAEGVCASPPCGIYAIKELDTLISELGIKSYEQVALGLVALSGKVVEHELGYRAASVEVVALAISAVSLMTADTPAEIDQLFQQTHSPATGGREVQPSQIDQAIGYIQDKARRYQL